MKYEQPYGVSDPNASYINGDPSVGQDGSIPPAASIEYPQREIVEVISRANSRGYTDFSTAPCAAPFDGDLMQLRKAIEGFIRAGGGGGGGGGNAPMSNGAVRLALSGTTLKLSPYNGATLCINNILQPVPSAGVTLAPSGLVGNTWYYIYAYMVGTVMTLEASSTAHVTSTVSGMEVKSGDQTRTLVGAAYTTVGVAWSDTDAAMFVLSWFNRRPKRSRTAFTANHSTSSITPIEIGTEIRNYFISWADSPPQFITGGDFWNSGGDSGSTLISFDGSTTFEREYTETGNGTIGMNDVGSCVIVGRKFGLTEAAVHYATLYGFTFSYGASQGRTCNWPFYDPTTHPNPGVCLDIEVMG